MPTAAVRRPPSAIPQATPAQIARYFAAKLAAELGPHNVKRRLDTEPERVVLLDVRSREGYAAGRLPGAVHIPFEELADRRRELPKGREVVVYCWDVTCLLATKAAYVLAKRGYQVNELLGGFEAWRQAGFPVEK